MDDLRDSLRRARAQMAPPEPAFDRLLDRRRRKHRNARIASVTMAIVVVGVGIAAAAVALSGSGPTRHVPGSSGESPASGRTLVAAEGQYYYSKTQLYFGGVNSQGLPTGEVAGPWTLTEWIGTDLSGRAVFADHDGSSTSGYSWPDGPDSTYGPGKFPLEDLSNLPTDPDELLARLTQRSSPGGASPNPIPTTSPGRSQVDTSLLRTLQDLFDGNGQFTPPPVRAAMFYAASEIEGVIAIPNAMDPVGRHAFGLRWVVKYEGPPSYVEWFFDPETKQLMAMTWTQDGEVLEARIVGEAGIADSTQGPPTAEHRFFPAADREPSFVSP